jgi:hypothetical protein
MRTLSVLVLAVVLAVATVFLGWWAVPVVGFLWGLLTARLLRWPAGAAALAAMLAWAALLGMDAMGGRLAGLGTLFGSIAKLPPGVFFALSLVFPALLAWSAAALGADLRGGRPARRRYMPASEVLGPATRIKGKARAHG